MSRLRPAVALLLAALLLFIPRPADAHHPYFEENDFTFEAPFRIKDPQVATAIYASLDRPGEVDYFTFQGTKGESVLVRMDIPRLPNQKEFAPSIVLMGPGLPKAPPKGIALPEGEGAVLIPPPPGEPEVFNEPFTKTSYWTRQVQPITLPADGEYRIAVFHPKQKTGRYVLSVGEKEVPGGDPDFRAKLGRFFER